MLLVEVFEDSPQHSAFSELPSETLRFSREKSLIKFVLAILASSIILNALEADAAQSVVECLLLNHRTYLQESYESGHLI